MRRRLEIGATIVVVAGLVTWGVLWIRGRAEARNAKRAAVLPEGQLPGLELGEFEEILGTDVLRAALRERRRSSLTSYESRRRFRNLLFVNAESGAAVWLLEDDDHRITDLRDIPSRRGARTSSVARTATLALVKVVAKDDDLLPGRVLLFTPGREKVVEVASGVRVVRNATLDRREHLLLVYERNRRYVVDRYDSNLNRVSRREIDLPALE